MTTSPIVQRTFSEIQDNPIGLGREVAVPICEGLNLVWASLQGLYLQYLKHHLVVAGAEFYSVHQFFNESLQEVQAQAHDIGERLNGLGGIPASGFATLAELCCFSPEGDDVVGIRAMLEADLRAEQSLVDLLRRQAALAESVGDRATRYLYERLLLKAEERAFHVDHFLAEDSLTLGLPR
ncbi:MAG: ferritin-like domain-containing protein [Thermostichus sp. HHBFW_bins_43]